MAKRLFFPFSLAACLAVLGGCAGKEGVQPSTVDTPSGTWYLERYGMPAHPETPLPETPVRLEIDLVAGTLAGTAGCNQFTASIHGEGSSLTIGPIAMTKKMCIEPAGVMLQESAVVNALAVVTRFRVDGQTLHLECSDGQALVLSGIAPAGIAQTSSGDPAAMDLASNARNSP